MATKFDEVYDRFLNKIDDYAFLEMEESAREYYMNLYLEAACVEFNYIAEYDLLSTDKELQCFNEDLDIEVVNILAIGMKYFWMEPKVLNAENMENHLNTKDINQYSAANLARELNSLRKDLYDEFKLAIDRYSLDHAEDIEEMRP